jgi:hypothetical protein
MSRDQILSTIRDLAASNGGRAPGGDAFRRETGVNDRALWRAGFRTYSEAVEAAGLPANSMQGRMSDSEILEPLATLILELGRFPSRSDIEVAKSSGTPIARYETLVKRGGGTIRGLRDAMAAYAENHARAADLAPLIGGVQRSGEAPIARRQSVKGYVYLLRSEKFYKIGRSNDVTRRRREVALLLPNELEEIHVIETDDPEGIEAYWHRRFAARQARGEWFALTADDVRAFKRRGYQ